MTPNRNIPRSLLIVLLSLSFLGSIAQAQGTRKYEHILIEVPKPYDRFIAAINSQGGRVTHQFTYVAGIAADIPIEALDSIRTRVGPASMSKDVSVPAPRSIRSNGERSVNGKQIGPVVTAKSKSLRTIPPSGLSEFASSHPDAYLLNNAGTRIEKLHARGFTGRGTIVAVIDSGYRPGFTYLDADHSLIGGKDFVGDGLGFANVANDGHGTFAAGLISGKGSFVPGEALQVAVSAYAPQALDPTTGELTLLGTAPRAKIYAVRVFGA